MPDPNMPDPDVQYDDDLDPDVPEWDDPGSDAPVWDTYDPRDDPGRLRERFVPRTLFGLVAILLVASVSAGASGVVLYAYYEYRLQRSEDRVEKFMDCAGRVLGRPGAERLLGLFEHCAELPDMREPIRATVPASHTTRHATTKSNTPVGAR